MANKLESIVFKPTQQHQLSILPPSLDELIDTHHPVRVVNKVVDQIDLSKLFSTYKGGGTSSYHPRMLLKVLIYGYVTNLYSSRKIETALKENIHFMWLSGMQRPDHNTINRFRGKRLAPYIKEIFVQVVHLLVDEGVLDLKAIFTDGTFMEARSNRYTFVWAKNTARHKMNLINQLEQVWTYAQSVADTESKDTEPIDFKQISPEKVDQVIDKIDQLLEQALDDAVCKKQKLKDKQLKKRPLNVWRPMTKVGIEAGMSDNGFEKQLHRYQAQNCRGCPLRGRCFKGDGNREIVVNHTLNAYKAKARERLISPQGVAYRSKRIPGPICSQQNSNCCVVSRTDSNAKAKR
ncbi:MAG: transposase [Balneolales bacterium]|nr:transposase [Balneolales bacterium]